MRPSKLFWAVVLTAPLCVWSMPWTVARAGEPTDTIKKSIDEVIHVLEDPALKKPEKQQERRKLLEDTIAKRFNFEEMAKRTLGKEWGKRSPEEQKEFASNFRTLLSKTYIGRIENYSGEKFHYIKETTDGDYAEVKTQLDTGQSMVPLDYKMEKKSGEWRVYDIVIEGTGLVQNYREQFKRILNREGFDALAKHLRDKAKGIDAGASPDHIAPPPLSAPAPSGQ